MCTYIETLSHGSWTAPTTHSLSPFLGSHGSLGQLLNAKGEKRSLGPMSARMRKISENESPSDYSSNVYMLILNSPMRKVYKRVMKIQKCNDYEVSWELRVVKIIFVVSQGKDNVNEMPLTILGGSIDIWFGLFWLLVILVCAALIVITNATKSIERMDFQIRQSKSLRKPIKSLLVCYHCITYINSFTV